MAALSETTFPRGCFIQRDQVTPNHLGGVCVALWYCCNPLTSVSVRAQYFLPWFVTETVFKFALSVLKHSTLSGHFLPHHVHTCLPLRRHCSSVVGKISEPEPPPNRTAAAFTAACNCCSMSCFCDASVAVTKSPVMPLKAVKTPADSEAVGSPLENGAVTRQPASPPSASHPPCSSSSSDGRT